MEISKMALGIYTVYLCNTVRNKIICISSNEDFPSQSGGLQTASRFALCSQCTRSFWSSANILLLHGGGVLSFCNKIRYVTSIIYGINNHLMKYH